MTTQLRARTAVGGRWWRYVALAAVLAIIICVLIVLPLRDAAAKEPPGLGLKVERQNVGLLISWNHHASELAGAEGALVKITGTRNTKAVVLSTAEMRNGDLFIETGEPNVRVELEVSGPAATYSQSVRVVSEPRELPPGLAGAPQPQASAVAAASPMRVMPRQAPLPEAETREPASLEKPTPATKLAARARTFQVPDLGERRIESAPVNLPEAPALSAGMHTVGDQPAFFAAALPAGPFTDKPAGSASGDLVPARVIAPVQPIVRAESRTALGNVLSQTNGPLRLEVAVTIDERGYVRSAQLRLSRGPYSSALAESVLVAAYRTRFAPATLHGHPIPSTQVMSFDFKKPGR